MNLKRVLAITRRLLQQFRRDRRTLALLFVAPIVILSLFYFMLRGGGGPPALGVVNQDSGPLGAAVAQKLEASSLVDAREIRLADADSQLHQSKLAGYVLLPSDFTQSALQQHRLAPEIHLEGSQPTQSQAVVGAVSQALPAAIAGLPQAAGAAPQVAPHVVYLYGGPKFDTLDYLGAAFIGLIVFFLVFVITIVSFLRERSQGTLERLMASPLRRGEIVVGYMLGFTALALIQAVEVLLFALYVVGVRNDGNVLLIFLIEMLMVIVAVNLGIFLSMFAQTEFQAVQFIPLVIVPQVLLSGIILPVSGEPGWLQAVSNVLPLTYAVDGMRDVMVKGGDLTWGTIQLDAGVVLGYGLLLIVAAVATLRRRVA